MSGEGLRRRPGRGGAVLKRDTSDAIRPCVAWLHIPMLGRANGSALSTRQGSLSVALGGCAVGGSPLPVAVRGKLTCLAVAWQAAPLNGNRDGESSDTHCSVLSVDTICCS